MAIQFYPSTPIGFHVVVHYDIAEAVELAHAILDGKSWDPSDNNA